MVFPAYEGSVQLMLHLLIIFDNFAAISPICLNYIFNIFHIYYSQNIFQKYCFYAIYMLFILQI